jgi:hypothetical protein
LRPAEFLAQGILGQYERVASIGNSNYKGITFELRNRRRQFGYGFAGSMRFVYTLSSLKDDGIVNTRQRKSSVISETNIRAVCLIVVTASRFRELSILPIGSAGCGFRRFSGSVRARRSTSRLAATTATWMMWATTDRISAVI